MIKKITLFCAALFLIFLVVNAFYTFPSADDFSYFVKQKNAGFWEFQKWHYLNWGGRYIPNAFLGFFKFTGNGLIAYQLIAAFIILGLAAGFYVFSKIFDRKNALLLASSLFLSYCFMLYSAAQEFYWMPGSITYTLGIILCLFVWSILAKINNGRIFLVAFIAVFILNGTNEVVMLMFNGSLILVLLFNRIKSGKIDRNILILGIFSIIFMLISILAPGNSVRSLSENNQNTHDILFAAPRAVYRSFTFLYEKFFIAAFVAIIFWNFADSSFLKLKIEKRFRLQTKIAVMIFPFVILIGGTFLSYFATGRIPPERTVNTIAFFFLLSVIVSVLFWKENFSTNRTESKKAVIFAQILIAASIFLIPNELRTNAKDLLTGKSADFSRQMKEREQLILKTSHKDLQVKKISALPVTVFFKDITADPNNFFNYYYAQYYHKNTVKTDE